MKLLPTWAIEGAIAYHLPSCTTFPIYRRQKHRTTGKVLLFDAPKGVPGSEYPLDECCQATPAHFRSVALMTIGGKSVSIVNHGSYLEVTNGKRSEKVWISPERRSAESLAEFFDGEIVSHANEP